eukprot:scaffold20345_cov204-Skeletonema_marinoi.AAC.15
MIYAAERSYIADTAGSEAVIMIFPSREYHCVLCGRIEEFDRPHIVMRTCPAQLKADQRQEWSF